jgi:hypothetical protein
MTIKYPPKDPKAFLKKYKIFVVATVALIAAIVNFYPIIKGDYYKHQLANFISKSSKSYIRYYGKTPDNQTYNLTVPDDFKATTDKQTPDGIAYYRAYGKNNIANVYLDNPGDVDPITESQLASLTTAATSSEIIKDLKSSDSLLIKNATFEKAFKQIGPNEYQINYFNKVPNDPEGTLQGSLMILIQKQQIYRLFVQDRQSYESRVPDFRQTVIDDFYIN